MFIRAALTLVYISTSVSESECAACWVKVNCGWLISQGSLLLASSANLMQWSVAAGTAGNSFGGRGYTSNTAHKQLTEACPECASDVPHTHFHLINFITDEHPKTWTSIIPWHSFSQMQFIYEMTTFSALQILQILSLIAACFHIKLIIISIHQGEKSRITWGPADVILHWVLAEQVQKIQGILCSYCFIYLVFSGQDISFILEHSSSY